MKHRHGHEARRLRMLSVVYVAAAAMLPVPAQSQDCGSLELTQSLSLEIVDGAGIACAAAGITVENSFARCYPPSDEPFAIRCVDIGIERNTGSDLPAAVNIYVDVDGCPPTHPEIDLVLLASEPLTIPAGTFLELFEIVLSAPVLIEAGETLVVELDYPAHADGGVWPGMNKLGETAPTYIRSEPCGIPNFESYGDICIWCGSLVQIVKGVQTTPWDLDGDGNVGIWDLLLLLAAWGTDPGGPPDFDGDGNVGILDLLTLLANWG